MEDSFSDERVMVVLNNKASLNFKAFTANDFDKAIIKSVSDLSTASGKMVQTAMENISSHVLDGENLLPYNGVPLGEYHQILCLELTEPGKENVIAAIEALQKRDDVLYACPDYELFKCVTTPSDEYYIEEQKSVAELIELDKAWNICTGLPNNYSSDDAIIVGVLDTGIDESHDDLKGNINSSLCRDFTTNAALGGVDCTHKDTDGHGTMCAGIIGAVGDNEEGMAGVCWNIELVSLRISIDGSACSSNVEAAINYAQDNGIDVLNLSFAWSPVMGNMERYKTSLAPAISNYSGVFVCAAGNDAKDNDTYDYYPSDYNLDNMITVGASLDNSICDFSNYGEENVDIFAPGQYIFTTFSTQVCKDGDCDADPDESTCVHTGYHEAQGTSLAAPYVAGVAALLLCIDDGLTNYTIKDAIMNSVDAATGKFTGKCVSGGRLNAFKAIMEITNHGSHSKSYSNITATTHKVTCNTCDHEYIEEHIQYNGVYLNTRSHQATCSGCGYVGTFGHEWSEMITFYKCMICGTTSTIAPEIQIVMPPINDEEEVTE